MKTFDQRLCVEHSFIFVLFFFLSFFCSQSHGVYRLSLVAVAYYGSRFLYWSSACRLSPLWVSSERAALGGTILASLVCVDRLFMPFCSCRLFIPVLADLALRPFVSAVTWHRQRWRTLEWTVDLDTPYALGHCWHVHRRAHAHTDLKDHEVNFILCISMTINPPPPLPKTHTGDRQTTDSHARSHRFEGPWSELYLAHKYDH